MQDGIVSLSRGPTGRISINRNTTANFLKLYMRPGTRNDAYGVIHWTHREPGRVSVAQSLRGDGTIYHTMVYTPRRQDIVYYRTFCRTGLSLGLNGFADWSLPSSQFMQSIEFLRRHKQVAPLPNVDTWSPRNKRRAIKQP